MLFDILPKDDIKKWATFIIAVGVDIVLVGLFTWGSVGGSLLLADTHSPIFALVSGFFSACLAASVWGTRTAKKHPLWKELMVALPESIEKAPGSPQNKELNEQDKRAILA